MHLDNLHLQNWLVHRDRQFQLTPFTVFSGDNGTGKTSIADAIAFAMLGSLRRIDAKGDRPLLINGAAERGSVTLTCGEWTISRDIANGKFRSSGAAPIPAEAPPEALPYCLDPAKFAADSPDERSKLLRAVMRAGLGPEAIKAELLRRGHDKALVDELDPRDDLDAWKKHSDTKATEGRGGWRVVAGENYGPEKAKGFVFEAPRVDPDALASAEAEMATLQTEAATLNRQLGALDQQAARGDQSARHYAQLRDAAEKLPDAQEALAAADTALAELTTQLEAARTRKADVLGRAENPPLICPCCSAKLDLTENLAARELVTHAAPANPSTRQERDDARAELARLEGEQRGLSRTRASAAHEVERCAAAAADLEKMAPPTEQPTPTVKREDVDRQLVHVTGQMDRLRIRLDDLRRAASTAEQARAKTTRAHELHAQVQAWCAIGDAIAPGGIPGELLARVLGPFNDQLRDIAGLSRWPQVTVGEDMQITVATRPYRLLSRSEQWRANASLALAIAMCADIAFVVLDEFDVLSVPWRRSAMAFLYGLTKQGAMDSVILLATMKEPPKVPAGVAAYWLGPDLQEQKAAA